MLRKEQNDLLCQTGPGTPMGQMFRLSWQPALLAEELPGERMPAGAGQAPVRAAAGLARHAGQLRADRRVLRPPRRVAVVRPERAQRPALPLSRLEVRPHRPVHRGAVGAGRERLLPEDQAEVLSAGRARRRAVDLHGPAGEAAAAAGVGVRHGAGEPQLHVQAPAGIELAAGDGGRHRFQPRLLPALRRAQQRSAVQGLEGQRLQHGRHEAGVRGGREPRRASTSARGGTPRTATTTGASPNG